MRIRTVKINRWRHFENITLQLDDNTGLVCIVGANGTGKSHLLELIAACAHRLGLSQGIEIPRGDPFSDKRDFSLQFFLAIGVSEAVDQGLVSEAQVGLYLLAPTWVFSRPKLPVKALIETVEPIEIQKRCVAAEALHGVELPKLVL